MYDVRGPTLIFTTQTHNPVTEQHTGYIFSLYDCHMRKPREFFFCNLFEAATMAAYWGADLLMNPDATPEQLTAVDYAGRIFDESAFQRGPPDGRASGRAKYLAKLRMQEYNEQRASEALEASELEELTEDFGYLADIDFTGEAS